MNRLTIRILNHEIIDKKEQSKLVELAQNGDKEAKDKLITSNMRLVYNIAKKEVKKSFSLELSDLMGYGVLGLIKAIEMHDNEKGKFSTYAAFWIRQKMQRARMNLGKNIRMPVLKYEKLNQGDKKVEEEFAMSNVTSMDKKFGNSEDLDKTLHNLIADNDDTLEAMIRKEELEEVMKGLTGKQKEAMIVKFGYYDGREKTYKETAKIIGGVTKQAVYTRIRTARKKLKKEFKND